MLSGKHKSINARNTVVKEDDEIYKNKSRRPVFIETERSGRMR